MTINIMMIISILLLAEGASQVRVRLGTIYERVLWVLRVLRVYRRALWIRVRAGMVRRGNGRTL
jgi:hypothetical protein